MLNQATIRGYIVSDIERSTNEIRFIVSVKKNYASKRNGFYGYNFIPCIAYSGYGKAILDNYATGSSVLLGGSLETFKDSDQVFFVVNQIDHFDTIDNKEQAFKETQKALKQYLEWRDYQEKGQE